MSDPPEVTPTTPDGLSYGELMLLTEGHGTSAIYDRVLVLRQRVERAEQRLTTAQARIDQLEGDFVLVNDQRKAAQAQAAALNNELCTAQDQIPPDMEGDSLSVALIKLKDARRR